MDFLVKKLMEQIAEHTQNGIFEFDARRELKGDDTWDQNKLTAWLRGACTTLKNPHENYQTEREEDEMFEIKLVIPDTNVTVSVDGGVDLTSYRCASNVARSHSNGIFCIQCPVSGDIRYFKHLDSDDSVFSSTPDDLE